MSRNSNSNSSGHGNEHAFRIVNSLVVAALPRHANACARVKWMAREISYRNLHNLATFIGVKFLCPTIKTEHLNNSSRPDLLH